MPKSQRVPHPELQGFYIGVLSDVFIPDDDLTVSTGWLEFFRGTLQEQSDSVMRDMRRTIKPKDVLAVVGISQLEVAGSMFGLNVWVDHDNGWFDSHSSIYGLTAENELVREAVALEAEIFPPPLDVIRKRS